MGNPGDHPPTRPRTIYIAQDKHLDYGWIHPVEQVVERLNLMTDFALDHKMRWNFDASIWVEEYLKARPSERSAKLLDRLRRGEIEVAANWLVPSPGLLSVEEMIHLRGSGISVSCQRRLRSAQPAPERTRTVLPRLVGRLGWQPRPAALGLLRRHWIMGRLW